MGDPLTKTNLCLSHPICDLYARYKTGCRSYEWGNGDDTTAITDHEEYGKYHLEAATQLGYEESPLDDVTSNCWGIYAEEWFHIPVSPINTCQAGSKMKNPKLLPYLDTPKLRVMIATTKDREDFSSDPRGKVTLMGHDEEYIPFGDDGPLRTIFSIASAFQDISLATIDRKEPLFLPRQVNGVGKPPPFWSITSWLNILDKCTPWHRKYYLTAMNEINKGTHGISGYRGALREQQHFDKEMMVELYEIPKDDPITRYIVVPPQDWDYYGEAILLKLVTLGHLVPESKIIKYYLMQERLTSLEQDLKRDLFEVVKAKMVEYPDISDGNARRIVKEFSEKYRETPYRLRTKKREPLYGPDVLAALESASPLRVTVSGYPLIEKFVQRPRPCSKYEEQGLALNYWFETAVEFHRLGENPPPAPQEILEDDPLILQKIWQGGADVYVIVTDDVKLFRLARNRFPDLFIARMSVIHFLQTRLWFENRGELEMGETPEIETLEDDIFLNHHDGYDTNENLEKVIMYERHLESAYKALYGSWISVYTLVDNGNVEGYLNQFNEDATGVFQKVEGIPWTSQIKKSSMKRIPMTRLTYIGEKSFARLDIPRSLAEDAFHNDLMALSHRR